MCFGIEIMYMGQKLIKPVYPTYGQRAREWALQHEQKPASANIENNCGNLQCRLRMEFPLGIPLFTCMGIRLPISEANCGGKEECQVSTSIHSMLRIACYKQSSIGVACHRSPDHPACQTSHPHPPTKTVEALKWKRFNFSGIFRYGMAWINTVQFAVHSLGVLKGNHYLYIADTVTSLDQISTSTILISLGSEHWKHVVANHFPDRIQHANTNQQLVYTIENNSYEQREQRFINDDHLSMKQ